MDFPATLPILGEPCIAITPLSTCSLGRSFFNYTIGPRGWDAANRALFYPFRLSSPVTVYKMAVGTGTGTTGNFDLGVYDSLGTRLVSTGSTAKTTASSERIIDVTDTLLLPGLYFLAMATDGTTDYTGILQGSPDIARAKAAGLRQMASAFPLPATATLATISGIGAIWIVSALLRPE